MVNVLVASLQGLKCQSLGLLSGGSMNVQFLHVGDRLLVW